MNAREFVQMLEAEVRARLAAMREAATAAGIGEAVPVRDLLVLALQRELEASEEAALWMTRETDVEVKLLLARQCGDEAKHYRLVEVRLRELGVDPGSVAPVATDPSPMAQYLFGLPTTVERMAAGPFAREALAVVLNELFIEHCEAQGDRATASLYRDVIQPDEVHHHKLGRRVLEQLAIDEELQTKARAAAFETLAIAERAQEMLRAKRGVVRPPGC